MRRATARGLAAALVAGAVVPVAAQPGSAFTGTVISNANVLNGSVALLGAANVNIASVIASQYPGTTSNSAVNTSGLGLDSVLSAGVLQSAATADPLYDRANSSAELANLNVASGLVRLGPTQSQCAATGSGVTGSATVTGLQLGGGLNLGAAIPAGPIPVNYTIPLTVTVLGAPVSAGSIILNYQSTSSQGAGQYARKVVAVRVSINVAGLAAVNLDVGTSECGTTVPPTPAVTGISPIRGSEAGGTSVTVTGTGFLGTTDVRFGSTSATSYTINSLTSITAVAPPGTSTVDVRVVNPTASSANTAADDYTYVPKPVITAMNPTRGPTAGGTSVTITGTNLTGATGVSFGGTAATSFSVDSATQITAVAPAGSAGPVDVRVNTSGGQSDVVTADEYTYVAVPTVSGLSPSVGDLAGGTSVTISGTGLANATAVKFGNASAAITANTGTSITVTAPAGSAGTVDVAVTTAGGTSANTSADNFTYVTQPTVTNVAPSSGPSAGGTSVTITGTGFAGLTGAAAVKFGNANATSYTVNSPTSITAIAPAGTAGTIDITVTNPSGTSSASAADQFTYIALPTVTNVSPSAGPTAGGTPVTITGTGFTGASAVSFGAGNNASAFTVVSPTQITTTAPAHSAGTVDVRVLTPGGTSADTSADNYTYAAAPTVSGISPSAGPVAGGTSVTITGTNFTGASTVRFGGVDATSYTVNNSTSITAVTPAGAAGPAAIAVTTAGGTVTTSGANRFTYVAAPVVTSVTPDQGPALGLPVTSVVIRGSGFSNASAVSFGGTNPLAFTVDNDTQITVPVLPGHPTGPVYVRVSTPNGGISAQDPGSVFTYRGAPTLTTLSPTSGPVSGGTSVTITGTGFTGTTGAAAVKFGATNATSYTVDSDTQITAVAPAAPLGLAGPVNVTVTTPIAATLNLAATFTYVAAPTVSGLLPASGPEAGGTNVVITGTGFTGATSVTFDGVPADGPITVSSDLSITAKAPAGTGTAQVVVTAPGGTSSTAGAGNDFTYVAAPAVTSLSPSSGPAIGGTTVTITGTDFTGTSSVTFDGTPVVFTQFTPTTITVPLAPAHAAGDVDVVVTTLNGGPGAPATYTYLGAPTLGSVAPARGPLVGGNQVVLTGTGFNQATDVDFGLLAATFTINSDTQITATAPAGVGTVNVTVSSGLGNTSNSRSYTYAGVPTVLTLSKNTGPIGGGTPVTLTGTGFTGATEVRFGTTSVVPTVSSDNSLDVLAPPHGAGTVQVTVVAPGGTSVPLALLNDFTYIAQPVVSTVSPDAGPTTGLTAVTINGSGFDTVSGAAAVRFGGVNAVSYLKVSDSVITAVTPAHGAGTVDVTVTTADGGSSAPGTFTYLGAPAVSGINPSTGPLAGGNTVTITGAGFTPASTVNFGLAAATSVVVNSSSSITATAPQSLVPGTVNVRVSTAGGISSSTAADDYTYVGTPVVSGLSPTVGGEAGGETVSITGTGFTGVTGVDFGGTAAQFTRQSDTLITASAPAHTAGTFNVRVSTLLGGTSANAPANEYTYVPTPVVGNLTPTSGPVAGGTLVTINGSGFTNATGVRFGNVLAANPNVVNDNQMTAVAPGGSAGTVRVTIVGPYASSASTPAGEFTYLDSPVVTGVSPDSGSAAGGTVVTISGTGFTPGSTVSFGATPGTNVQFVNSTTLRASAPAGPAGLVDVAVTTTGGTSSTAGSRDDFRYVGQPTVSGVAPAAGPLDGGNQVVITGTQFFDVTTVTFGGTPATNVTRDSATQLTVTAPAHAAGPVAVVVTTSAGGASAAGQYTYQPAPTVTGLSPASGPVAGGTPVVITGTGFTTVSGPGRVKFGTENATYTVDSDTQITATSPAMSMAGTFHVTVTGQFGTSPETTADQFTYAGLPTLGGITPNRGALGGGTPVTVTGTGFTSASRVFVDGVEVTPVTFVDATELRFLTPAHAAGIGQVSVQTTYGTSGSVNFTYVDIPQITSVTPAEGPETGGTAVVVRGSGFASASSVRFGGDTASFSIVGDTEIRTTSPGGTGTVNLRITGDGGLSQISPATAFEYLPAPTVTSIAPASGPLAGRAVVITGTGFTGSTAVRFGATAATTFSVDSPTQITATAPPSGTAATVEVVVSTPNGDSGTAGNGNDFSYVAAPVVGDVTPDAGPLTGGTVVTITGSGFTGATLVRFGSLPATLVTVSTDGLITATAPAQSAGVVDVTVTAPGGTSATSPADQFRYQGPAVITSITPDSGSVQGGSAVTIRGSGFSGTTQVFFGGVGAQSFTVVDDTTITAVTPAGLVGDRSVRLQTPAGLSPAATYTYVAAPNVTGLDPSVGPIAGGTRVTITGTGFTGATAVSFGGTSVTPTVSSNTSLTVTTPAHAAGTVDITVTGPNGTSAPDASSRFRYVEPGAAPLLSRVDPNRGPAAGGNTVTLSGIGFTGATAVTVGGTAAQFTVLSDTQITVTVPPDGTGTLTVQVTTPNGTSSENVGYTYVPLSELPRVDSLSPNVGPVAGGTVLTINGARFDEQTMVTFDGVPGTGVTLGPDVGGTGLRPVAPAAFRAAYSNSLSVVAPPHPAGPVTIEVSNAAGTTSFVQSFTFIPVPSATTFAIEVPAGTTSVIAPRGPEYTGLKVQACGTPTGGGSTQVGAGDLACAYTAPTEPGTDSFTMDVVDVIGQQATQTVQITVVEEGDGTGGGGGNNGGGDGSGTGGGGGNDNGEGSGTGGGGGNDGSGPGDGSGDGSGTGSGSGSGADSGDGLAFTGTPYFLVPAIAFGFVLILLGSGLISLDRLRSRPGRRR
ncbi:IPT/TIG domain-containing protein [Kineosporia rhizophila]|uniref:IPT/TIG domain-containing protein n=1 Tax=Kineosporia rhizophila TaxID=84633 RepID=UPI001E6474F2|nr:IPT/TIG domain-containing protein [Kineosporia rhizophila]MCE0539506.1 IPT/TIG domain-containing protein [Kineosporia rhizophila]